MSGPLGPPGPTPGITTGITAGLGAPPEFSRGRVLPGVAAGCALPVVGILLAFLLGLGLVLWSGTRPAAEERGDAGAGDAAGSQPVPEPVSESAR
ncbi:MAG: hypothetical protein ACFCVG_06620 [Kineosporiaceae bacterium]